MNQENKLRDEDWSEIFKKYDEVIDGKISPEYIRGFTRAIQTIQEQFDTICMDLKYHKKRPTEKLIREFLQECLNSRTLLRDFSDSFVRWNPKQNKMQAWRESWSNKISRG